MTKVVIIGAGEIGSAIKSVLSSKKDVEVELRDKNESKIPDQKPLAAIIPSADFVFLCVPSWAMRAAAGGVAPLLNKNAAVISLAKGIEMDSKKTIDDLLEEILPKKQKFALLSGPMIAEELVQGMGGFGVVASTDREVFEELKKLFIGTKLFVEYSKDVRGVSLAGILKNIYAVGLGIVDGLGWSGDIKGWLTAKAINEMAEVIKILKGKSETALGTAGLGDLVATGFSEYSRNREAGEELIKTKECCLKSEGINSLPVIIELLGLGRATALSRKSEKFPILKSLERIILKRENAEIIFEELIASFER